MLKMDYMACCKFYEKQKIYFNVTVKLAFDLSDTKPNLGVNYSLGIDLK